MVKNGNGRRGSHNYGKPCASGEKTDRDRGIVFRSNPIKGVKGELRKELVPKVKSDPSGNSSGDDSNRQQNSTPVGSQAETIDIPGKPGKGGKDAGVQINPENGFDNHGYNVGGELRGGNESNSEKID